MKDRKKEVKCKIKEITQDEFDEVKPRVVNAFNEWMSEHIKEIIDCVSCIQQSEDLDEFLDAKRDLMQTCINFPFNMGTCIQCQVVLEDRDDCCEKCPYGKERGICEEDDCSTYDRIKDARAELEEAIANFTD